jgi:hypothetical protein
VYQVLRFICEDTSFSRGTEAPQLLDTILDVWVVVHTMLCPSRWKQFLCPLHIVRFVASRMSSHSWKSACSCHIDLAIPLSWYHVIMATRCSVVYTHWPVVFKNVKYSPKHTKQTLLRIATFDVSIIQTVSTATFYALCRIAWSYKSVIISRVYCMNLYLFIHCPISMTVSFLWASCN